MRQKWITLISAALISLSINCQKLSGLLETANAPQPNPTRTERASSSPSNETKNSPALTGRPLPNDQDLDLQTNHANGSVLRVTHVAFKPDHITIDFTITNGYEKEIKLNELNDSLVLRDNVGNKYNFSPPAQNPELRVAPRTTLQGKAIFLGRIAPSATSLTLTTNDKFGGNQNFSVNPKMVIDNIPVQR